MAEGFQMIDPGQPAGGITPSAGGQDRKAGVCPEKGDGALEGGGTGPFVEGFFDYELPAHLIAQEPCAARDEARLLVLYRAGATLEHRIFQDLPELLTPGDLLVLNDTKVMPARLVGRRARTGGKWEGLFLRQLPDGLWELLCQTHGRLAPGETVVLQPGEVQLHLVSRTPLGHWLVRPDPDGPAFDLLESIGHVPLPPYIRKGQARAGDRARYQTVYARRHGAVAAPTAGLHFTPRLFERLKERGIDWAFLTLHVGLGTLQPIRTDNVSNTACTANGESFLPTRRRPSIAAAGAAAVSLPWAQRRFGVGNRGCVGTDSALVRRDGTVHSSALRFPRGGRIGDELSLAENQPASAGERLRRPPISSARPTRPPSRKNTVSIAMAMRCWSCSTSPHL